MAGICFPFFSCVSRAFLFILCNLIPNKKSSYCTLVFLGLFLAHQPDVPFPLLAAFISYCIYSPASSCVYPLPFLRFSRFVIHFKDTYSHKPIAVVTDLSTVYCSTQSFGKQLIMPEKGNGSLFCPHRHPFTNYTGSNRSPFCP